MKAQLPNVRTVLDKDTADIVPALMLDVFLVLPDDPWPR